MSETERERQTRQTETDRDRDALTFYCLQLTSPQDKDRERQADRQTDRSWSEVSSDAAKTCFDYSVDQLLL